MKLESKNILVVGDVMLDEYIFGTSSRLSPEAPVPVVRANSNLNVTLGGAGNVAKNLSFLGAKPILLGIAGPDKHLERIASILHKIDCEDEIIVDGSRCTTRKVRLMSNFQHIARIDYEVTKPLEPQYEEGILKRFKENIDDADLVLVSDYGKGVLTEHVLNEILNISKNKGKITISDPKMEKNGNLIRYSGSYLIKPNRKEAESATTFDNMYNAGIAIKETTESNVLITKGMDGMELFLIDKDEPIEIPAHTPKSVYDVSGAGDTVLAILGLTLANDWNIEDAVKLANVGGSIAVSKMGTEVVSREELENECGLSLVD